MTETIHKILGVNPKNYDSLAPQEKIKEILSGKFQPYFNKIINNIIFVPEVKNIKYYA